MKRNILAIVACIYVIFLTFASFVFQGDTQGSDQGLKDLLALYQSLPENFSNNWDYRGTRNYMNQSKLSPDQKTLVLSAIDLISGPKSPQKLEHFRSRPGPTRTQGVTQGGA